MNTCPICSAEILESRTLCESRSCKGKYARSKRTNSGHNQYHNADYREKLAHAASLNNEKRFGKWLDESRNCLICDSEFVVRYRSKKTPPTKAYCSPKCSGKGSAEKTRRTLKNQAANNPFHGFKDPIKRQAAIAKADHRCSSKAERAIRTALKERDPSWQAHRHICGKAIDVVNHTLKVLVEYDGPTHFRPIFGEDKLRSQQERDQLVERWCLDNHYRLYRISDLYLESELQGSIDRVVSDINQFMSSDVHILKRYTGREVKT